MTLCAILDMKLFNTDIIDTVADDKRCLIQGWCFKKSLSTVPKRKNLRVSTVRYTASSWRHIKFSKICLVFCFSTGSKYYDPNFWLLWKFILRHNSLKNYCKMILNKRKFAYFSKKWFCICQNGGVVLYTQSLYYKGFRFYGHFKIFPINLINASTADHLFLASTTNLCCPWIYSL